MKLFVDTGNVKDIEALAATGIIDGVTTNPSLMAKEAGDPRQILKQICKIVGGPVSAEVVATDAEGMIREGRELAADFRGYLGSGVLAPPPGDDEYQIIFRFTLPSALLRLSSITFLCFVSQLKWPASPSSNSPESMARR